MAIATEDDRELWDFIAEHIDLLGDAPSYRAMCEKFGWGTIGTAQYRVTRLLMCGAIRRDLTRRWPADLDLVRRP